MRKIWLAAWVAALLAGCAGSDRSDLPEVSEVSDRSGLSDRSELSDLPEGSEVSDRSELSTPEPLLERGEVLPPDSLPCLNLETGREQTHCNHHGSSVAVTADGTVLVVWYHGMGEYSKDSRLVWSRRGPGGEFGPVEVLYDDPGKGEGNPVVWVREDGILFVFFVTVQGENWNDAEIRLLRSVDGGTTWSGPQVLREDWGWMVRNHPLRMSNGELLLPCYSETLYIPAYMVSGDDFAQEWEEIGGSEDPQFFLDHVAAIQPTVIERSDHTLLALHRNTASGGEHQAWESVSADFGRTWSPQVSGPVPNDSVGFEMARLASGRVMVVFNNTLNGRYPLAAALSEDEGKSWSVVCDLDGPCETGDCSHGYTSLAQDPTDQSVWVTFTDERKTIGWVHLNEAWLLAQEGAFATE